jgi:hypothetical protein
VTEFIEWTFEPAVFDRINENIDLPLAGYVPGMELVNLLKYNTDTDLE